MAPILFLLLIPLLHFIFRQLKSQNNPPGPTSWPIIGTINHLLNPMSHITLANLAHSYGPLMHFKFGAHHLFVASSPSAAAEILKANDRVLSGRHVPQLIPLTQSEINKTSFWADTNSDGWKNIRAVCRTELFSAKALEYQTSLREEKVAAMVENLRTKEGLVSNVEQIVFTTVINIFSNVYFSKDLIGLEDEFGYNDVKGMMREIGRTFSTPNLSDMYEFLGKLDPQGLRRNYRKLVMRMRAMWEKVVRERRELYSDSKGELMRKQDFLDKLISRGFGDDQINQLLEDLFTAGIHTTTSTINSTMIELITTQESMAKLNHELDTSFSHQNSSTISSLLENLPYLQACVKETLRLHPPAPLMLTHRAYETCRVMNYTIPKNARVVVNVWAIGRDPNVWEEPTEYKPERFIGSSVDFKGNDFEFLPFGAGRRICPGLPMAANIMHLIVASLVYFFDWSDLDESVGETLRATSEIRKPLLLISKARK